MWCHCPYSQITFAYEKSWFLEIGEISHVYVSSAMHNTRALCFAGTMQRRRLDKRFTADYPQMIINHPLQKTITSSWCMRHSNKWYIQNCMVCVYDKTHITIAGAVFVYSRGVEIAHAWTSPGRSFDYFTCYIVAPQQLVLNLWQETSRSQDYGVLFSNERLFYCDHNAQSSTIQALEHFKNQVCRNVKPTSDPAVIQGTIARLRVQS